RAHEGADHDAGKQEHAEFDPPIAEREAIDREGRRGRRHEGEQGEGPKPADMHTQGERQHRAKCAAATDSGEPRIGERVAEEPLQDRAADCKPAPDNPGKEETWHTQVLDDPLLDGRKWKEIAEAETVEEDTEAVRRRD